MTKEQQDSALQLWRSTIGCALSHGASVIWLAKSLLWIVTTVLNCNWLLLVLYDRS